MGVMLNPYGNRLGISNFWQNTFNIYYSENLNFKFYELFSIVKFTIDLFILNLFENTKKSKDASFLLLFVSLNLNILKFKNKRLDVFLKLFDYRMFVMVVENNYKTRHYMLLRFLRMFFRLFTFRIKKMQKIKNIVDWKLLAFYDHIYTRVVAQKFKNKKISKKQQKYENKGMFTKNYFYKILYKLCYFIRLHKLEISKLKYFKNYIKCNKKVSDFFFFVKKKFYKKLVAYKNRLMQISMHKKKLSFKMYKKYIYFKNFLYLFSKKNKSDLLLTNNLYNVLGKLNQYNNKIKYKKKRASLVFKFYRSNFKFFFLKKRPFVFTIFQKNTTKNPVLFFNSIKNTKNKKIKYSDFGKLHTSYYLKSNYRILRYSLRTLKKQFFSQINIKKEIYFRKNRYNFLKYINENFFTKFLEKDFFKSFMKLFVKLETAGVVKNEISEEKDLDFLRTFFSFVEHVENKNGLIFLSQKFFDYKRLHSLTTKYKNFFDNSVISNDFLLFSKLIIFFYKLQKVYDHIIVLFNNDNFFSKNVLTIFMFKYYAKFKGQFNSIVKSSFFLSRKKKNNNISLTKKYKIEKINAKKYTKSNFLKKIKTVLYDKNFMKKKEKFLISLTRYTKNLKTKQQNQNLKDIFVNKFDYFFQQATKKNKKTVIVRMKKCKANFIILTLPFLFKIMQMYNFEFLVLKCNFVSSSVSAAMIARYAITRMRQGFSIGQALYGMRFGIKRSKKFAGFKFCAAGRFSRRQIATYRWIKGGSLAINTRIFGFDYAHDNFIGTFGIYGFKVWLLKAKKKINPTYG